jgi:hypothetical protein
MGGVIPSALKGAVTGAGSGMKQAIATAPSNAEVSQSSSTDAVTEKRRRGKSPTILTDALGNSGTAPTESKTLLGS